MTRVRARGEQVRSYIIDNVGKHPTNITRLTIARFGITRQAVNQHVHRLVDEGALLHEGATKARAYKLAPLAHWIRDYTLPGSPAEDQVWMRDIAPSLGQMPQNVAGIWQYAFTEMFNNALEHSEGTSIGVDFTKTAANAELIIFDDGIGIFKKIQAALGLQDERHSVLELAKGKFTTDPARHSGQGIFFASRMFDDFAILSGEVIFSHELEDVADWIVEREKYSSGTAVFMTLSNHTSRTTKRVFDKFASESGDYGFTKTVVPVRLARYGDDDLVSRSQARRLLARVDRFKLVMLDFDGVDAIGQAFADEIFRVFPAQHPEVSVVEIKASSPVRRMISRARSTG